MHRRPHALPIIVTKCAFLLLPTLTSAQFTPNQTPATKPAPISNAGRPSSTTGVNSAETAADKTPLPAIVPAGRKSIGIALEGGGALGLAHAGVLAWLEDHHIPIDRIAGTSMGALVGSLYASGKSPAEIQKIAASNAFTNVFTLRTPYAKVDYRRRQDRQELPQGIQVGLKGGPSLRNALLVDSGLNSFLELNLDRYNQSELNYNTLPIPFRCIAADLTTLQSVVFDGGPVPQAVRASISIPGIFAPVEYRGHYLVDGAILDNLPTDIVKQDLHADIVIGVHLKSSSFSDADVSSIVGVFTRAYAAGTARTEHNGESLANILITADTSKFSTADYASANRIIAAGYAAAEQQRALLEPYALNDADWQAYLADRHSREIKRLPILQMVNVQGGTPGARARVASDLAPLKGQPITVTALDKALEPVQGNGAYQASVETFQPSTQAPIDGTQGQNPDTGVRVRLSPVRNGPPFLLIGADVTAESSNVTRTTFDFRLINQNLGGYGSELRSDLRVGFLTQASTEYYRLLSKSSLFLQPHLGILREPVYIWQDQRRISERLLQQAGGGLDFGQTVSRNMQYTFEYRAQVIRWHLVDGEDDTSSVSGTSQTALAHFVYNSRESGTLSPRGTYIDASAGALFNSVQSQTAPILRFTYGHSFPLPSGIIAVSAEGNTYFGRSVAEPLRFTLGGPLRLSASSIDEYRGTDDFLVRAGYLHRLITIPFGVGEGLYATVGYEGGEMWSPENPAILSQDGFLLGLASTPLGVFQFGGAVGDAGHRKVFLSFGRLF